MKVSENAGNRLTIKAIFMINSQIGEFMYVVRLGIALEGSDLAPFP
jgi:hypothetical protein